MRLATSLLTLLLAVSLTACGSDSTGPSSDPTYEVRFTPTTLGPSFTAPINPTNGTVGDTAEFEAEVINLDNNQVVTNSLIVLGVSVGKVFADTTLSGFTFARSDSNGKIHFQVSLDTISTTLTINAVAIRAVAVDTISLSEVTPWEVTINPDTAKFIACGTGIKPCSSYFGRVYSVGDTIRASDFINGGQVGLVDSMGQFKALLAYDRFNNPTTVLPTLYLAPDTTVTSLVADSTTSGQVYVRINGEFYYLVSAKLVDGKGVLVEISNHDDDSWALSRGKMYSVTP